jgi:hypothetical protein
VREFPKKKNKQFLIQRIAYFYIQKWLGPQFCCLYSELLIPELLIERFSYKTNLLAFHWLKLVLLLLESQVIRAKPLVGASMGFLEGLCRQHGAAKDVNSAVRGKQQEGG